MPHFLLVFIPRHVIEDIPCRPGAEKDAVGTLNLMMLLRRVSKARAGIGGRDDHVHLLVFVVGGFGELPAGYESSKHWCVDMGSVLPEEVEAGTFWVSSGRLQGR